MTPLLFLEAYNRFVAGRTAFHCRVEGACGVMVEVAVSRQLDGFSTLLGSEPPSASFRTIFVLIEWFWQAPVIIPLYFWSYSREFVTLMARFSKDPATRSAAKPSDARPKSSRVKASLLASENSPISGMGGPLVQTVTAS